MRETRCYHSRRDPGIFSQIPTIIRPRLDNLFICCKWGHLQQALLQQVFGHFWIDDLFPASATENRWPNAFFRLDPIWRTWCNERRSRATLVGVAPTRLAICTKSQKHLGGAFRLSFTIFGSIRFLSTVLSFFLFGRLCQTLPDMLDFRYIPLDCSPTHMFTLSISLKSGSKVLPVGLVCFHVSLELCLSLCYHISFLAGFRILDPAGTNDSN